VTGNLYDDYRLSSRHASLVPYFVNIDTIPAAPVAPRATTIPPEELFVGYEDADTKELKHMVAKARFYHSRFQGELQARDEDILKRDQRIQRLLKQKSKRFQPLTRAIQRAEFQDAMKKQEKIDKANMSLEEAKGQIDDLEHKLASVKHSFAEMVEEQDTLRAGFEYYEGKLKELLPNFVPYGRENSAQPVANHKRDFRKMWKSLATTMLPSKRTSKIGIKKRPSFMSVTQPFKTTKFKLDDVEGNPNESSGLLTTSSKKTVDDSTVDTVTEGRRSRIPGISRRTTWGPESPPPPTNTAPGSESGNSPEVRKNKSLFSSILRSRSSYDVGLVPLPPEEQSLLEQPLPRESNAQHARSSSVSVSPTSREKKKKKKEGTSRDKSMDSGRSKERKNRDASKERKYRDASKERKRDKSKERSKR